MVPAARGVGRRVDASRPGILLARERTVTQEEAQAGGRPPGRLLRPPRALAALPAGGRARLHRALQNTADVNTERTFASLKARFPDWTAARDASAEEIEEAIALGGLAHTKAPRIKRILEAISERTGAPDLSELDGDERRGGAGVPRRAARASGPRRPPACCCSRWGGR